jgi:fructuronate reductase
VRLSLQTIGQVPASVGRPAHDPAAQARGIVHFGLGAFHRAHQAVFTDDAMDAGDRDWGVIGVSPRSARVRDALSPQDGLYSVTERSEGGESTRVIGAIRAILAAPTEPLAVIDAVASPATRLLSFTVTEKGYCRRADSGLDADLAGGVERPASLYGFLAVGLARRKAAGLPGVTLLSCDNLAGNGARLAALLGEYCERQDPSLAAWVAAECAFPSTMVDRIVPATTAGDLARIARRLGLEDQGAVVTEPFRQWVIEDRFAGPRPRWEAGGALFVEDVRPFEAAKLRMLNGAHSALAYLGLARGLVFVHEAVADPVIAPIVEALMRREAAPSVTHADGQDLEAYADALLARFANSALPHALAQIASDGSQKIPQRWLETLAWAQSRGASCPALLTAVAAWMSFTRLRGRMLDDPMAETFARLWASSDAAGVFDRLFGSEGLFARTWTATPADRSRVLGALAAL